MAVYGYVRVSTRMQVEDGESLDVQTRQLAGYAMMKGWAELDEIFREEGVSGSKPLRDRPEGARLLEALRPGDTVIAPKLDRMFRSSIDALDILRELKARQVSLHLLDLGGDVSGEGMGKLIFTILSAVAEAERDRIRERIRDNKRDSKARGLYLGGRRPFGFQIVDGVLVEDPQEQAARSTILEMRAGGASLRTIAEVVSREGTQITHTGVRGVLEQEASRIAAE